MKNLGKYDKSVPDYRAKKKQPKLRNIILGCLFLTFVIGATYKSLMVNSDGSCNQFVRFLQQVQMGYSADTALLVSAIGEYTADAGVTIDGLLIKDGGFGTIDQIQYNTSVSPPSHSEGLTYWDSTNKTLALLNEESDVIQQVGQEIWIRVRNETGGLISNGEIVYLSGIYSTTTFPTIAKAKADAASTSLATIGVATHSIETGTYGYITRIGTVRSLNTTGCTSGDILYLSAATAGAYTNVQPDSPNYSVRIGNCGKVDASNGTIEVDISVGGNTRDVLKIFNGAVLEDTTTTVTSNGTTITLSYEQSGGGDLSLFFDGLFTIFDSTPAATVSLTAGTDTSPTLNYIFIPNSTNTLTANTTGFPTGEQFVPVATVVAQSAASAQTDGLYKVHAWTDHLSDSVDQGHLSHVNKWIRTQNATYESGVATTYTPTVGGGGATTIHVATTSGTILQLHDHSFPAFDTSTGSDIEIINEPTTPYLQMAGLVRTSLTQDSAGGSLSNRYYNAVLWGVISEDSGDCHIFLNLPSGSYGTQSTAQADSSGYTNTSIPIEYRGTGFLISKVLLQDKSAGGTLEVLEITDLRGLIPGGTAGGTGGVAATQFSDNDFAIFNNADNTKVIDFDASNIATATTRSIIMGDYDVDFSSATTNYVLTYNGTKWLPLAASGGGASTALDNLSAVAINTSLLSDTADTDSLGSTDKEWLNIYIGDAGKFYLGLSQDTAINRSAANTITMDASSGVLLTGPLGITGTRVSKGWFTDLEVTNAIAGSITGNAATVSTITGLAPDTATTQATQAAITTCANLVTVGTIGTGVWQGTAIDGAYIDIEGTEIKSTGETGATKFLREDGDGTCSWQTPAGGGGITSLISKTDNYTVTTSENNDMVYLARTTAADKTFTMYALTGSASNTVYFKNVSDYILTIIGYEVVASDAVEAGSTATVINATSHSATAGDILTMTSGDESGESRRISSVATNTITLENALSGAPSATETFKVTEAIDGKYTILLGKYETLNVIDATTEWFKVD
jgi:hypothetical protein